MMLDKKQIRMTFLLAFKISHKEVQTACNNVFGPAQELLMNIQCSSGSRGFAKEMSVLRMRNIVAGHQKLTVTN